MWDKPETEPPCLCFASFGPAGKFMCGLGFWLLQEQTSQASVANDAMGVHTRACTLTQLGDADVLLARTLQREEVANV